MRTWMRWVGVLVLLLVVAGCGGGSSSQTWETVARNQVSKFLDGFSRSDVNRMGQAMAPRVTIISGSDRIEESKVVILAIFEAAFQDYPIRNFIHGPIELTRSGSFVTAQVSVSYQAAGPVNDTWRFTLVGTDGTWLIREWEIGIASASLMNMQMLFE